MQALNISSRVWFIRSVWSSVCKWYALLKCNVPIALFKVAQNLVTDMLSPSDTIDTGLPIDVLSLWWIAFWAGACTFFLIFNGMKWADFLRWSLITQIVLLPFLVGGNLEMKSIMRCSHFHYGMSNGLNKPGGFWCFSFQRPWSANIANTGIWNPQSPTPCYSTKICPSVSVTS